MLKLLNLPPAVATLLMFMVLCTMLGMHASTGSMATITGRYQRHTAYGKTNSAGFLVFAFLLLT